MMNTKKSIVLMGATGFVGKYLVNCLLDEGYAIYVVGRSKEKIQNIFEVSVTALNWDELGLLDSKKENVQCVINLAGTSIADKRWTKERKEEIIESRVQATDIAVAYCLKNSISLLNASAVGIYGQQTSVKDELPPVLDEKTALTPQQSEDFLSFVCHSWEKSTEPLKQADIRCVNLRLGVVLGKGGGALEKMALPFYLFAGGPIGSGHQPVPWISLDDVCRAICFLVEEASINGPVNLTAPGCVSQKSLAQALGKTLKRPSFMPTPGFILKIILGQMAEELLLNGQHVYPQKLIDHGFAFKHATIDQALGDIYTKRSSS